jgi:hypothetical protein
MAYAFLSLLGKGGDDFYLKSLIDRTVTEIDIPEGVKQIGAYSLNYCGKLKRVTFPETLTYVGVSSVSNCPLLERVVLSLGCNAVRSYAFSADTGLKSVVLGDTVEVQAGAFSGCTSCILYDFTRCTSVSTLANTNAFQAINAEAAILVPASLYRDWVVATNWVSLADHIVPLIVGDIGVEEFADCTSLKSVAFSDNGLCTNIGDCAFYGCTALESIEIPDSVTRIGAGAFERCSALENVTIGKNVAKIGESAFNKCSSTLKLDCTACTGEPPTLGSYISLGTLEEGARITVPAASLEKWKTATNWARYADYIVSA